MPGPKPPKKPKAKPVKHSSGSYSFIDCEEIFEVGTEIFQWSEEAQDYLHEDEGTFTLESGQQFEVDNEGKISDIY